MTSNPVLRQALACAERGWPVFPCQPGRKTPATPHGYLDATTDPAQVNKWFSLHPERNLAVATGAPGPDVLDVDYHGRDRNGYNALEKLRDAGLLDGIAASAGTPNRGLHLYLTGSQQRCGHLAASYLDFLAQGGYVLVPPSRADGRPYYQIKALGGDHGLDWSAAVRVLQPSRKLPPFLRRAAADPARPLPSPGREPGPQPTRDRDPGHRIGTLARWLAAQREGNRNNGLFWAANRALEADPAADLSPLAAAARQAGLDDAELTRTLDSARRTAQPGPRLEPPDHQPEGAS